MAGYKSWLPEYEFNHKYRGLALVFVQEFFDDTRFSTRKGASKDVKKMRELFEKLDFKVKVYKDLNRVQIMEKLEKARNCKYNKESDCFACVISTHGEEMAEKDRKLQMTRWKNTVFGKDCQSIFVDEILDMFSNKKCEGLKDKPKLFFIQACRSRHPASQDHLLYDWGGMVQIKEKKESKDYPDSSGGGDGSWSHDSLDVVKHHEKGSEQDKQLEKLEEKFIKTGIQEQGEGDEFKDVKDCVNIYEDWEEDEDEDEFQSNQDEDKEVEEEEEQIPVDELEAGGQTDSGIVPQGPQELTPINCPDDCLVLYPVMPDGNELINEKIIYIQPFRRQVLDFTFVRKKAFRNKKENREFAGRFAFRNSKHGSWMLHYMYEECEMLVQGASFTSYLTTICRKSAKYEYSPSPVPPSITPREATNLPFKVTTNLVHRLSGAIHFEPKASKSLMGKLLQYLQSLVYK